MKNSIQSLSYLTNFDATVKASLGRITDRKGRDAIMDKASEAKWSAILATRTDYLEEVSTELKRTMTYIDEILRNHGQDPNGKRAALSTIKDLSAHADMHLEEIEKRYAAAFRAIEAQYAGEEAQADE